LHAIKYDESVAAGCVRQLFSPRVVFFAFAFFFIETQASPHCNHSRCRPDVIGGEKKFSLTGYLGASFAAVLQLLQVSSSSGFSTFAVIR
jgi:hypothetical protein